MFFFAQPAVNSAAAKKITMFFMDFSLGDELIKNREKIAYLQPLPWSPNQEKGMEPFFPKILPHLKYFVKDKFKLKRFRFVPTFDVLCDLLQAFGYRKNLLLRPYPFFFQIAQRI